MLYLAIDQHRKQLTVNIRTEQGDVVLRRQVSTRWKAVRQFFEQLQQQAEGEGGFVVIVEVCGFNHWLLKLLSEYGCAEIVLIQPEKRSKKKTDRRDANALGELLWVNRQRLLAGQKVQGVRRVRPADEAQAQDRQLTGWRDRLGKLRTRTLNRVQHILLKHNLQQECPTRGIQTKKARRWLAELPLGEIDRLEMDQLLAQWKQQDEHLQEAQARIEARQKQHPTAPNLATIPGCAAYSSLALAARVGPIERFPRPDSLANYWGLTPGCRSSGETQRLGSITKEGSTLARFLLGQMVRHVLQKDAAMRAWYRRIKKRRGSKIARVAVMRRLATIIWCMIKYNQPYTIGGAQQVGRMQACLATLQPDAKTSAQAQQKGPPASGCTITSAPAVG